MINVLFVGPDIGGKGGIASVIKTYTSRMRLHGVIELKTYETGKGINNLLLFVLSSFRLIFFCIFKNVDIVYVHSASKGSFFRKSIILHLSRLLNKPVIFHLHGGGFKEFYFNSNKYIQSYIRYSVKSASRFVVLSEGWKSWFKDNNFDVDRFNVVHNGVNYSSSGKSSPKLNKVVYAGRLVEGKGLEDLIQVFAEIVKINPSVILNIAGSGDLEYYKNLVSNFDIEDKVHFCGWVTRIDLDYLLNDARCLVLPSYAEGMPMCILESFSNKTPVVVTNVGSIPEVVIDGFNGLIIEPGDLKALFKCINSYCIDDELCIQHGKNAFSIFEQSFSDKVFIQNTYKVIEAALKQ